MKTFTTEKVSKQGGTWQVLEWDGTEWVSVGPYWDTEAEAEAYISKQAAKGETSEKQPTKATT